MCNRLERLERAWHEVDDCGRSALQDDVFIRNCAKLDEELRNAFGQMRTTPHIRFIPLCLGRSAKADAVSSTMLII